MIGKLVTRQAEKDIWLDLSKWESEDISVLCECSLNGNHSPMRDFNNQVDKVASCVDTDP